MTRRRKGKKSVCAQGSDTRTNENSPRIRLRSVGGGVSGMRILAWSIYIGG